jgi:aminoglycoside phosphotransferase
MEMTGSRRIGWAAVPADVRRAIEELLGRKVLTAESLPGGFSEGVAARLRLQDDTNVFVKAISTAAEPSVAGFHRREAAVTRRLPAAVPVPRLLAVHDDGEWVALLFEHVTGALPAQPWRPADLERVLATATAMAGALTPSPIPAAQAARPRLRGWAGIERPADPWAAAHRDELIRLEAAPLDGDTLLHGDLYPFNVLLDAGRVHVVDWPHAWVGPAYADVLTLMSTAADPERHLAANPLTRGLDPLAVDAFLAAHSGFLLRLAQAAGADPRLLDMASALGHGSLRWLRQRRRLAAATADRPPEEVDAVGSAAPAGPETAADPDAGADRPGHDARADRPGRVAEALVRSPHGPAA